MPQALPAVGALALLALPCAAQSVFMPRTDEFRVNPGTSFNQYWVRVDTDPTGSTWSFSYENGQDPLLRLFDFEAAPLGQFSCVPTLNAGVQDEPEVCVDRVTGNILVAWSERHGYDGEQMGIYGRVYAPNGTPLGNEFQINEVWQASQWRPLMVSPPTGGFLVTWSGDWDADGYFRLLDSTGAFLTGDLAVNVFINGGQADTAPAIAPDGTIFFAYVDYGQAGGGTGTNLWGRTFDAAGNPQQPIEFKLTTPAFSNLDQREPRVAADGLGRFIVVWQTVAHDGSSWGVFGRIFDTDGAPLTAEFQVNSTTLDEQWNPRVAAADDGSFIVVFEDQSSGTGDIRARRFDAAGAPIGLDFVVTQATTGNQARPSLAMTPSGDDVAFCWEGPGVSTDVFARFFAAYQLPEAYCTAKQNSAGCSPSIIWSGTPSLGGADDFVIGASQVLNNKNGILFWGTAPAALPFGGGTLCVAAPVVRTDVQDSTGNPPPNDCSGSYFFAFTHAYMQSQGLQAGDLLYAQYWQRDPGFAAPDNVGLTDALTFEMRP